MQLLLKHLVQSSCWSPDREITAADMGKWTISLVYLLYLEVCVLCTAVLIL